MINILQQDLDILVGYSSIKQELRKTLYINSKSTLPKGSQSPFRLTNWIRQVASVECLFQLTLRNDRKETTYTVVSNKVYNMRAWGKRTSSHDDVGNVKSVIVSWHLKLSILHKLMDRKTIEMRRVGISTCAKNK